LPATATTLPGQPPQYGRADLISKRATGQFSVVETVKAFVEQKVVYDKYFPRGFVTMQYFRIPASRSGRRRLERLARCAGKWAAGVPELRLAIFVHLIFGFHLLD